MNILDCLGNTPLVQLASDRLTHINLYAKLEFYNPTGSTKDRSAHYVLSKLLETNTIGEGSTIIESSSGNFGIALSVFCKQYGLNFSCVVDPDISSVNEMLIHQFGAKIEKVTNPDSYGGYLLNRIQKVHELLAMTPNSYWINQYSNPIMAEAYYHTLGRELCEGLDRIDYVFVGVSSGGTITGVSRKVKEEFPNCKVIAVDVEGSIIFGGPAKKRSIPGIGSSMVPTILKDALIDDVVIVDEANTVQMCHELLRNHFIFAGGSSGSVFAAVTQYFQNKSLAMHPNVVVIFPDRGDRYVNKIYVSNRYDSQKIFS